MTAPNDKILFNPDVKSVLFRNVKTNQIKENEIEITNGDVNHIKNVLRKNIEDEIEVLTNYINIFIHMKNI